MKFNKLLIISMLVMMICCVSAVSATDINATDDITVDEVSEVIEEVEIDDVSDDVVEEQNLATTSNSITLTQGNYEDYFDGDGYFNGSNVDEVIFSGNFTSDNFKVLGFDQALTITGSDATFTNFGFELVDNAITLNGINFVINAPSGNDCIAINVASASNSVISNNVITYNCTSENDGYYNHVVRVVGGENVTVSGNNITAYLPLKNVDFNKPYPSIYTDLVAGVAVQSSNNFRFTNNRLLVNASKYVEGYPTLDAFIIAGSTGAYIGNNTIIEIDPVTQEGDNNYLYAIDVYQCNNITIDDNNIRLESKGGSIIPGTNNGTGTAYGIQLTGGHTGVTISNNDIYTSNNGPNAGIYSQNFMGRTELNITGNTIYVEGNAGLHEWSLVTGMELGDDYVYVAGNIITVKNKADYAENANAYGISYSQWTPRNHEQHIIGNTVTLINGDDAIYMMGSVYGSEAINNCLESTNYCGNDAVNGGSNLIIQNNYCPNCDCTNCSCH
ncbi:MAG: hypothetical protein UIB63_10630 [Methanobrevibacter sp.]|uniref:hypothetical protein n=1 Tax=Methanobrevibacter sp. TaxID=66852 RepID=UPI002E77F90D|nr:hypothetical protein [Methanobrevibacter sp.]MEE0943549.1 hypothetical protein [Methanobrevibacter sp.]